MTSLAASPGELRSPELDAPASYGASRIHRRVLLLGGLILVVVAVIALAPGLTSLRTRLADASPGWLLLGGALKVLSGLSYVAIFRAVFCRRMSWRLSSEIGLAELGANAVLPTGGAGGLALGAWALRRSGMDGDRIARRSVAFFFLTSVPNVLGVILLGLAMACGVLPGHASPLLTLGPVLVAVTAVLITLASGRLAARAQTRLAERHGERARLTRILGAISGGVSESLALLREHDPALLLGLLGYLLFDVMILWATFHAFGSAPPAAIIGMGYLIGELGGLIPVPGGLGGVDLGLVGTLVLYHVPIGAATAAVLAYRALALWIPAVLGSAAFVALKRSLAREAADLSACSPADTSSRTTVPAA